MIKFQATNALVHSVSPVIQVTDKFQKRELVLDDSWDREGKHYPNFVLIEFAGDKMAQLDSVYPGQRVNVEGVLGGREYNNRIYNSVRGQSVTPYQAQQQHAPAVYPQQPQYAPVPAGYPQPVYPQPAYAPAPAPPAYDTRPHSPGKADLPFQS